MVPKAGLSVPEPVFIIGLPNSYTTITAAMLGQHPALEMVPELNLFVGETVADWAAQPGGRPMAAGLLRTVAQLVFGAQTAETVHRAEDWLAERAGWSAAHLFDHLRAAVAPAALIEQSPRHCMYPASLDRITRHYPNARYIRLTRNPARWLRSVANWGESGTVFLDRFMGHHAADGTAGRYALWHMVTESVELFLAERVPGQILHVRGEDVVGHPRQTMARIAGWAGLAAGPAEVEAMLHPERSVYACWGPPGAHAGFNPDFMSAPSLRPASDPERLLRLDAEDLPPGTADYARSLGYR